MKIPFLSKSKQAQLPATVPTFWRLFKVAFISFAFGAVTATITIAVLTFKWYNGYGQILANPILPSGAYKVLAVSEKTGSEYLVILKDSRMRVFLSKIPADAVSNNYPETIQVVNSGWLGNRWKFPLITPKARQLTVANLPGLLPLYEAVPLGEVPDEDQPESPPVKRPGPPLKIRR